MNRQTGSTLTVKQQGAKLTQFRLLCWGVVAVTAVTIIATERNRHEWLDRSVADGALVNIAGRQRMLSQRIARQALEVTYLSPAPEAIDASVVELVNGHHAVATGIAAYGLSGRPSSDCERQLAEIEPEFRSLVSLAEQVRHAAEGEERAALLPVLLEAANQYVTKMDALVFRLADEASERNGKTRAASVTGCGVVLAMLIGLPLMFMDPAIATARRTLAELVESHETLASNRRRIEQALTDLSDQVQITESIFSTAADAIIVCNRRGRIEKANRTAARLFACESVVGMNLLDLVASGCREDLRELLRQDGPSGPIGPARDMTAERADGDAFAAEVSLARVDGGDDRRFTAIVRDVSDRQQMQDQLAQAEKLESVGKLASGIAHEINTPLQYLASNLKYLGGKIPKLLEAVDQAIDADNSDADPQQIASAIAKARKQIPAAISDCDHGVTQVSDIISAMKEFAHPGVPTLEMVDVNRCVRNAVTISHSRWKKSAEVRLDLDQTEPQALCLTSPLSQTLLNLLVNAADAIVDAGRPAGEGQIVVRTQAGEYGVTISVSDNGCGMSDEVRRRVFDPFFTTKGVGRGSGQGLAIAYNAIVGKLGGSIDIESAPGEGTTFTIWIAAEPASEHTAGETPQLQETV